MKRPPVYVAAIPHLDAQARFDAVDVRAVAREEVASLAGLVVGRLGEVGECRDPAELEATLRSIFGEALQQLTAAGDVDEALDSADVDAVDPAGQPGDEPIA